MGQLVSFSDLRFRCALISASFRIEIFCRSNSNFVRCYIILIVSLSKVIWFDWLPNDMKLKWCHFDFIHFQFHFIQFQFHFIQFQFHFIQFRPQLRAFNIDYRIFELQFVWKFGIFLSVNVHHNEATERVLFLKCYIHGPVSQMKSSTSPQDTWDFDISSMW